MMTAENSGPRSSFTPLATTCNASMSRPESVSSMIASWGSSMSICRISLRFFSPPEKPSFRYLSANLGSICMTAIFSWRSLYISMGESSTSRTELTAVRRKLATVANFLRTAVNSVREVELSPMEMYKLLQEKMAVMQMDPKFAERYLNEGFSGGEKKRNEILQMLMLEPQLAIMDETDSGLDIDALQVVARGVNEMRGPEFSAVLITHYQRILRYIEPDRVHVMLDGRLVTSGGKELAEELEDKGYDWVRQEFGAGAQS